MGSRCRRYSSAFEQLAWELPGAVEAGDVPVFCHHQCPLWRHPGECGFPASVPAEFGRSSCCRAQFLHYRPVLSVQGKRLVQSISYRIIHLLLLPQNVLFAIGSAFLQHANHFKLYSSFCASHSKAQKVLLPSEFRSCCFRFPFMAF